MRRHLSRLALALCLLLTASGALADETNEERSAAVKKRGDDAMAQSRYAEALARYDEALALFRNAALHYNRARALERLNFYARAVRAYEQCVAEAPPELLARTPLLPTHVAELRAKTALVTLKVSDVPSLRVLAQGTDLGRGPFGKAQRFDAGVVTFEASAKGCLPLTRTVELRGGEERVVDLVLSNCHAEPVAAPSATPAATNAASPAPERDGGVLGNVWFWAGAAAVVAAGTVTLVVVLSKPTEPPRGDIDPGTVTAPLLRF